MNGIDLIKQERERQIEKEGWTAEHDDEHTNGELIGAAVWYALFRHPQDYKRGYGYLFWPWQKVWQKPTNPVRDLAKAGALIAAEIDRLQRENSDPTVTEERE